MERACARQDRREGRRLGKELERIDGLYEQRLRTSERPPVAL